MDKLKLFFSYTHKDKTIVDKVRNTLQEGDFLILGDHLLLPGQNWQNAILEQIRQAEYFIMFISPDYLKSGSAIGELYSKVIDLQNTNNCIIFAA